MDCAQKLSVLMNWYDNILFERSRMHNCSMSIAISARIARKSFGGGM
jgi:hypothetical protein